MATILLSVTFSYPIVSLVNMSRTRYSARIPYTFFFTILLSVAGIIIFNSCAAIMQGTTQDVRVIMPPGTQVTDVFGNDGDPMLIDHQNGYTSLRLKRKKDYTLKFAYKGQEAITVLSSSLEPGWVIADFTTFYGLIVDGLTGAWNSFDDPIRVRFPADTTLAMQTTLPLVEVNEGSLTPTLGIVVTGNAGLVFPMAESMGLSYGLGVGYQAFPRFTFFLEYEGGTSVDIFSQYSSYYSRTSFSHVNLECRIKALSNFYLTAGGGLSNISSDSLGTDRYVYNDTTGITSKGTFLTTPINKWMPTIFAGIGISGSTTYFELRHTFGLSHIFLPNGEIGKFETTTLTFGLNLPF
jgi:hypothetical protein